jgi:hypothetical protein
MQRTGIGVREQPGLVSTSRQADTRQPPWSCTRGQPAPGLRVAQLRALAEGEQRLVAAELRTPVRDRENLIQLQVSRRQLTGACANVQ